MENAKAVRERLGLPPLKPEVPRFGYSLVDWDEEWDENAPGGAWALGGPQRIVAVASPQGVAPNTSSLTMRGELEK